MRLSIVSSLYQSEAHIEAFVTRSVTSAKNAGVTQLEVILVNDGSTDGSLEVALEVSKKYPEITIVDLSRNFGHHKAMMEGLRRSSGDLVFLIDCDLEELPEWLSDFKRDMDSTKADVVYGVQSKRRGGLFERLSGRVFYQAFRYLTGVNQPDDIVTARLMTRQYVDALVSYSETEINIGGLWVVTGFKQVPVEVEKLSLSPTTYTFRHKVDHFVNAITSFSSKPLIFVFYLGFAALLTATIFIILQLALYFAGNTTVSGYTTIVASIWFFSGLILFSLGIQGIYLSKVFSEVKRRPNVIVRRVYLNHNSSDLKGK